MIGPGARLIDRYEVTSALASGGMADVFLARDERLDRTVAVKAFRVGAAEPRRFETETRLLAGLHHPNLVSVLDAGEHEDVPFMVLQYIDGPTLARRLESGPLSESDVERLAVDLASALDYVHAQRIVHRDVKPSNVLFDNGRALLGDFGVARFLDATRLTLDASTVGTAAYLAPEQATGGVVDGRADVYSLGLVVLESLTGRPGYTGSLHEVMAAKVHRDPEIPAGLPPPWPGLLTAMTRRDPSHRPSAAAVLTTLGAADVAAPARTMQLPVQPPVEGDPLLAGVFAGAARWRRPLLAAIVVLGLLGLGGLGLALLAAGGDDTPDAPAATTTTVAPTTSTTPTTSLASYCASLEAQKKNIEEEKKAAERGGEGRGRGDDDDDDDDKEVFEERKKVIEEEMKAAGC